MEPARTLAEYRRGSHLNMSPAKVAPEKLNKLFFGRNFTHRNCGTIGVGDVVTVLATD